MDAPVRLAHLQHPKAGNEANSIAAEPEPEEEHHQLSPLADVPQDHRPSQARLNASVGALCRAMYIPIGCEDDSRCIIIQVSDLVVGESLLHLLIGPAYRMGF